MFWVNSIVVTCEVTNYTMIHVANSNLLGQGFVELYRVSQLVLCIVVEPLAMVREREREVHAFSYKWD